MSKEIQAKFDKKAKDVLADTLGLGEGSSVIEIPANSRITLNGNKLLQLLIAKGVDVDAELTPYSSAGKSGILLGWSKPRRDYLESEIKPHMIYPASSSSSAYLARWTINGMYSGSTVVDTTVLETHITYKSMLSNIGEKSMDVNYDGKVLIPCLAVTASSSIDPKFYNITTSEFLSFISITPLTEEAA